MPTAWPDGKSQLETIFDGDTLKQVESVWLYLSDGPNAAVPYGLGRDPIPLVADKEPVLYRNFIQGAGPRAIGVGYPEKANLAFDANDLRLALIWQGAFIDASKHWTGRGEGFQGPLGDNILTLPTGPSFAVLPDDAGRVAPPAGQGTWRQVPGLSPGRRGPAGLPVRHRRGPRRGLPRGRLRRRRPRRSAGPSTSRPTRPTERPLLPGRRRQEDRAAGRGWYAIDGEWKVRISADSKPIVRESAGKAELIVPVKFDGGKARIVEEYAW